MATEAIAGPMGTLDAHGYLIFENAASRNNIEFVDGIYWQTASQEGNVNSGAECMSFCLRRTTYGTAGSVQKSQYGNPDVRLFSPVLRYPALDLSKEVIGVS